MSEPGTPTFDQLRLFLAIVDEGSFGAAARRLNRAVSVVSYGVANLEAQLGLTLFELGAVLSAVVSFVVSSRLVFARRATTAAPAPCPWRSRPSPASWRTAS